MKQFYFITIQFNTKLQIQHQHKLIISMSELVQQITHQYTMYSVTCKVLVDMNILGYPIVRDVLHTNIQLMCNITNITQYLLRIEELIKDTVLRNIRDISNIKWKVKCFGEFVSFHWLITDVARILQKYVQHRFHINLEKTIVVEITNGDRSILVLCLSVDGLI